MRTINGYDKYSTAQGIYISREMPNNNGYIEDSYAGLYVQSGATLNWNGGEINYGLPTGFKAGANVNIKNGILDLSRSTTIQNVQIRYFADINVDGLKVIGAKCTFNSSANITQFSGYNPVQMDETAIVTGGSKELYFDIRNFIAGQGSGIEGTILSPSFSQPRFINPNIGSSLIIDGHFAGNTRNGLIELVKEIKVTIDDDNGKAEGVTAYIKDYDNGNRRNWASLPARDYLADRVYTSTTNASGETDVLSILTADFVSNSNIAQGYNYRSKNNDNEDIFDINLIGYNYQLKTIISPLKGGGVQTIKDKVFFDTSITEQNKTTVDAYTTINTAQKFYDRAKSFLVDNYSGETATIVTRSENTIYAGFL